MIDLLGEPGIAALIGLGTGIILGAAARIGRFCTLGAVEDYLYGHDSARIRMWGVALAVAILGSFGAMALGRFDPGTSFHLSEHFSLPGAVIGGLVFGYGMALAGNCGYGALARMGGGDLRAFVLVMVMGLSAYVTISGPLAAPRVLLFPRSEAAEPQGIAHAASALLGLTPALAGMLIGLAVLVLSLLGARRAGMTRSQIGWAAAVGAAITAGWLGTYWLAMTGFDGLPVVSHSFSGPIGETLLYAMTSSGAYPSFAVGSIAGIVIGAFLGAAWKSHLRWEACDDPRELKRQILGAALVGWGGTTAAGCSIGQGLTAFSLLAISAPITLAAIWIGAAIGLRQIITGFSIRALD